MFLDGMDSKLYIKDIQLILKVIDIDNTVYLVVWIYSLVQGS